MVYATYASYTGETTKRTTYASYMGRTTKSANGLSIIVMGMALTTPEPKLVEPKQVAAAGDLCLLGCISLSQHIDQFLQLLPMHASGGVS